MSTDRETTRRHSAATDPHGKVSVYEIHAFFSYHYKHVLQLEGIKVNSRIDLDSLPLSTPIDLFLETQCQGGFFLLIINLESGKFSYYTTKQTNK